MKFFLATIVPLFAASYPEKVRLRTDRARENSWAISMRGTRAFFWAFGDRPAKEIDKKIRHALIEPLGEGLQL
jgi:hypothetical protein